MRTLLNILFTLFILFTLCSCNSALLFFAGMKKPHLETKETIKSYAKENKIDSASTLLGKDSVSMKKLMRFAGKHANIVVFNKDGYLVSYTGNESCPGPVENYLRGICTTPPVSIDSTVSLNSFYDLLIPLYDVTKPSDLKNNDLNIFLFWTVWYNKKNKNAFGWRDILSKEAGSCNYKIFMVNYDFRAEHYGLSKRSKINLQLTPKRK